MKKVIFVFCFFCSLIVYSQKDSLILRKHGVTSSIGIMNTQRYGQSTSFSIQYERLIDIKNNFIIGIDAPLNSRVGIQHFINGLRQNKFRFFYGSRFIHSIIMDYVDHEYDFFSFSLTYGISFFGIKGFNVSIENDLGYNRYVDIDDKVVVRYSSPVQLKLGYRFK